MSNHVSRTLLFASVCIPLEHVPLLRKLQHHFELLANAIDACFRTSPMNPFPILPMRVSGKVEIPKYLVHPHYRILTLLGTLFLQLDDFMDPRVEFQMDHVRRSNVMNYVLDSPECDQNFQTPTSEYSPSCGAFSALPDDVPGAFAEPFRTIWTLYKEQGAVPEPVALVHPLTVSRPRELVLLMDVFDRRQLCETCIAKEGSAFSRLWKVWKAKEIAEQARCVVLDWRKAQLRCVQRIRRVQLLSSYCDLRIRKTMLHKLRCWVKAARWSRLFVRDQAHQSRSAIETALKLMTMRRMMSRIAELKGRQYAIPPLCFTSFPSCWSWKLFSVDSMEYGEAGSLEDDDQEDELLGQEASPSAAVESALLQQAVVDTPEPLTSVEDVLTHPGISTVLDDMFSASEDQAIQDSRLVFFSRYLSSGNALYALESVVKGGTALTLLWKTGLRFSASKIEAELANSSSLSSPRQETALTSGDAYFVSTAAKFMSGVLDKCEPLQYLKNDEARAVIWRESHLVPRSICKDFERIFQYNPSQDQSPSRFLQSKMERWRTAAQNPAQFKKHLLAVILQYSWSLAQLLALHLEPFHSAGFPCPLLPFDVDTVKSSCAHAVQLVGQLSGIFLLEADDLP
eukprot:ANDGO_02575.mRNA.1 hypothetical protein